jgi:hypothetical protein
MGDFGFGMASVAFWAFLAAVVVGGIWSSIREKEARHETLRRIIESGKDVDADVVDRIMKTGDKTEADLKVGGYITMSVAPGLVLLGYVLQVATGNDQIFTIMLGVGGLVFFVSIGLLVAAQVAQRKNAPRNENPLV